MAKKYLCIYHGNCADGFGAAWVVRHSLGGENVDFYSGKYGEDPPDCTGRQVIFVDFSYKRNVMLMLAAEADNILVIDHHISAIEDLVNMPSNVVFYTDTQRSGAMLAWIYFFPNKVPPILLRHIEDRDLWKFELPGTREVQAALFSYPYEFEIYDELMNSDCTSLYKEGEAIERKHFKDINELLPIVTREMDILGHIIPVANLPYIHSPDAAMILAENKEFGACYWDTPKGRQFSLRSSMNSNFDVAKIAEQFGGGGHKHAAGFLVSFDQARKFELS